MSDQSSNQPITLTVDQPGQRLDQFIAEQVDTLSRSQVQRLIKDKVVQVNGVTEKASYRLEQGDIVSLAVPEEISSEVQAEEIELDVLYEGANLVAVNKPAGMVVHPAHGNDTGTLVHAALYHWPQMSEVGARDRAGIVHRLDKDTSGVILLAKTPAALESLQGQFKTRTVLKRYIALVEGIPASSTGLIEAAIGRDTRQRKRMTVVSGGREATTRYDLIEEFTDHALLSLQPLTGRTHQLRVHLAWLGHPVVGDRVYGYRKQRIKMKRFFLHAAYLEIDSPSTGKRLQFEAPLPLSLEDILAKLRRGIG